MVYTAFEYMARFTIWSHIYIYPYKLNKPEYVQLYISDSTEATTIQLDVHLNQGLMVNTYLLRHINECIK
jgi:hypothetical protein